MTTHNQMFGHPFKKPMGNILLACISKTTLAAAVAITVMLLNHASASDEIVKPGDRAVTHFTCRLPNGDVAVSTYQAVAEDPSIPKSQLFIKKTTGDPLPIDVAVNPAAQEEVKERGFENEVVYQLSKALIGIEVGKNNSVEIKAVKLPEGQKGEYLIKISRVRQRPKEMRFTPEEYKEKTGNEPKVGRGFIHDPAIPGKVVSVDEKEVMVRFFPEPGKEWLTPFGKAMVREREDKFEIVIDARPGSLVRSEHLVGRIVAVDDLEISIDYSHPFGGEPLRCEVFVDSLKQEEPGKEITPVSQSSTAAPLELEKIKGGKDQETQGNTVKEGDLVEVNYTAFLEDGSLIYSTRAGARGMGLKLAAGYKEPKVFAPEEVVAGTQVKVPGVGESVVGMRLSEKKRVTLGPASAYGPSDPGKVRTFPCMQTLSKTSRMPPAHFVQRFNAFPIQGKEFIISPYLKARVTEVTETSAALELLAQDGDSFEGDYGSVKIQVSGEEVLLTLTPRIGAPFKIEEGQGIITGTDGKEFTVDFNSPLAGKAVVLDLEVISITPASTLQLSEIRWIEDHDQGLSSAKNAKKPAILVLYADWCSWCKKLLNESLRDPRVKAFDDRLVWIKVNSDNQKDIKAKYQQNGFPLILFLDRDGQVVRRIDGYVDAAALKEELRILIQDRHSGKI